MTSAAAVVLFGLLGAMVGTVVPSLIRLIPDRPADSPDADQPVTPYRELASTARLPVLVGATAVVFALTAVARGDDAASLPTYLVVATLGVAISYIDVREHRLPDWLTLHAFGVAAIGLLAAPSISGEWGQYGRAWLGAAAVSALFLALALVRPSDLGMGDVKLSASAGMLLGWVGWDTVVVGVFFAFLIGGLVGLTLILARRANRRTALPFGPFILAGSLLALLWSS